MGAAIRATARRRDDPSEWPPAVAQSDTGETADAAAPRSRANRSRALRGSRSVLLERNLALIGFMTAGKTRVGESLSRRTGMPFHDVDALIADVVRMPIHEIFQVCGEPYFRRLETRVLAGLCEGSGQIIGCGGGTVISPENREILERRCISVWLRVSEPEVLHRLEDPQSPRRPLLEGLDPTEVVRELMRKRESLYARADYVVDTDGQTVQQVAERIVVELGLPAIDTGAEA